MDDLALFDAAPFTVAPAEEVPAEKLSADRRRTVRQAAAVARGVHPLALVFGAIAVPMHPNADRTANAGDARNLPLRCGSCRFRQMLSAGNRSVPKCAHRAENATHSAATDVRAWWPACTNYSAGDTAVSDDAARWIPEVVNA